MCEPGPALLVLGRPGEPSVTPGRVVAPDRQERVPQPGEAHAPRMGTRTPRSTATASASSYPASTCLITPVAGSLVSTRSSFCAASSVPSATQTWPAWIDRPMPTPPPWWTLTHDAPDAALTSAFRI